MDVRQSVEEVFIEVLRLEAPIEWGVVRQSDLGQWDSLNHVAIIVELEERFSVTFDAEDIAAMTSFSSCLEILKKLGVS